MHELRIGIMFCKAINALELLYCPVAGNAANA